MKLLVPEPGTDKARTIWSSAERIVSSQLLYPETRSALGRLALSRRVGRARLSAVRSLVEELWGSIDRIDVSEEVARAAGELAETHALHAYDAVHLASALSVSDDGPVLVAADRELLAAARTLGLATAPVL